MYFIKRVKAGEVNGVKIPAKTHYATQVAPAGNVTGWTEDAAKATTFPEDVAIKSEKWYQAKEASGTKYLGTITVEPVE